MVFIYSRRSSDKILNNVVGENMKLIVGLGNPGKQYEKTRHNVGFSVLDEWLKRHQVSLTGKMKFKGEIGQTTIENETVLFLKPKTYMNLSGESVQIVKNFYNINDSDILVIYDDLDLTSGTLRIRQKGSSGGHNGLKSIISCISSENFHRLRVGIDRDQVIPVVDYVLGKFSKEQMPHIKSAILQASEVIDDWIAHDILYVMNKYN
jgi:PTH1 family peptidyl-tRNA hydrolase